MRRAALLLLGAVIVYGSNFSEAIKLYKSGQLNEAKDYFERAYHGDGVDAAGYFLGVYYSEGIGGVEQDYQKAKEYLQDAVRSGNIRAKCVLARIYRLEEQPQMAEKVLGEIDPATCERLTGRHTLYGHTKNVEKKD